MLGESPKEYELLTRIVSRGWMISRQPWWQYLWSIPRSPHQGSRRRKTSLFREKFRAGNKWPTKIGGPQIHNLYINVMSWFMDHKKRVSVESIFCILRLPGINWCCSQPQAHKVPAAYTLQATCSKLKPKLFAGIMLHSGQMKMKCCWSGWR